MREEDKKKVIMYREFERTFQQSSLLVLHRCKRVLMSTLVGDSDVVVHPLWSYTLCGLLLSVQYYVTEKQQQMHV